MNREGEPSGIRKTLLERTKDIVHRLGRKHQDYHEDIMKQRENSEYIGFAVPGGGGFVRRIKRLEKETSDIAPSSEAMPPKQEKDVVVFNQSPEKPSPQQNP